MIDIVKNQVVIVDANGQGYFVELLADGTGYGVFSQAKDWKAARRVNSPTFQKAYLDPDRAFNDLTCWLACRETSWSRRTYLVNGMAFTREEFSEICSGKREPPRAQEPLVLIRLTDIEHQIAHHMNGAYQEFLAVGRCLVDARDANLVPHGQWEEWVTRNTGLSQRQAQRLMQAARLAAPGSALEKLPLSKITALLMAPEDQREALAEKALAENTSVRELKETVSQLRHRLEMTEKNRQKLEENQAAQVADLRRKALKEQDAAVSAAVEEASRQMREMREAMMKQGVEMERVEAFAKARMEEAEELKKRAAGGISRQAQEAIDQLRRELKEAENYGAQQAQARQAAQQELLEMQSQAARSGYRPQGEEVDLGTAVRTFMGAAGVLPHMGSTLAGMPGARRQEIRQYVDMIDAWVQGARRALSVVLVTQEGGVHHG